MSELDDKVTELKADKPTIITNEREILRTGSALPV